MSTIALNLQAVNTRITAAARSASRDPRGVTLLAVSKGFDAVAMMAAASAGQTAFGENYLQEALDKIDAIHRAEPGLLLEWHFIGPIQSNKTRAIAERFDWVHTIEREKIAQRLSEQRPAHLAPLNICLQINISGESTKSGVAPADATGLATAIMGMPNLRLRGLMAIPEATEGFEQQRAPHRRLRELYEQMRAQDIMLDTLSMGMSGDMEAAVAEGATIVRVGTAIFGNRDYAK